MKTAISIPDDVFRTAESFARRRNLSRSAVFTIAVSEFLEHHRTDDVTEQLDKVYGNGGSSLDPALSRMQMASLTKEKW